MPTATDSLMSDAKCIDSCIPPGMQLSVLISLFAQIAGVSTDTNSLMAGATCINSCIPQGMQLSVLVSLAMQIVSGGGAGVACGNGAPTSTPSSSCAFYIQTDGVPAGVIWEWYNGAWH